MPGYVKIGRTTNLEQRIRSLDTTGVPLPFECFYACTVNDSAFVEKQLHDAFLDHRVRSSREFYKKNEDIVITFEEGIKNRSYIYMRGRDKNGNHIWGALINKNTGQLVKE